MNEEIESLSLQGYPQWRPFSERPKSLPSLHHYNVLLSRTAGYSGGFFVFARLAPPRRVPAWREALLPFSRHVARRRLRTPVPSRKVPFPTRT